MPEDPADGVVRPVVKQAVPMVVKSREVTMCSGKDELDGQICCPPKDSFLSSRSWNQVMASERQGCKRVQRRNFGILPILPFPLSPLHRPLNMSTAVQQVLTNQELLDRIVYDAVTVAPRFDDDAVVWRRRKANRVAVGRVNHAFARAVEAALYQYGNFHSAGVFLQRFGRRVAESDHRARLVRDIEICNMPSVPPAPSHVGPAQGDAAVVVRVAAVLSRLSRLDTLRFADCPPSAIATVVDTLVVLATLPCLHQISIYSSAMFEQPDDIGRLWRLFNRVPTLNALHLLSDLGEPLVPSHITPLCPLLNITTLCLTAFAWPPHDHPPVSALLPNLRIFVVHQVDGYGRARRLLEGCPTTLTTIRLDEPQLYPTTFPEDSHVVAAFSRFPRVTTVAVTSALFPHARLADLPPSVQRVFVLETSENLFTAIRALLGRPELREIHLEVVPKNVQWADTDERLPLRVSHALETVGNIDQFLDLTRPRDISEYGTTDAALRSLISDAAECGVIICGSLVRLLTSHERYQLVLVDAVMSWAVSNDREDVAESIYGGTEADRESMDAWRRHHGV